MEFDVGDYIWVVLTKDWFSIGKYNKLSTRKIGSIEIIEKINPNAYRLRLPNHIQTVDVFNAKHLIPYTSDTLDDNNSRVDSVYLGENDGLEMVAKKHLEKWDKNQSVLVRWSDDPISKESS